MRGPGWIAFVLTVLGAAPAFAQLAVSTHARSAAMADATTAGDDATTAVVQNPAGLAGLQYTTLSVSTQAATSRLWSAQPGRSRERLAQNAVGFGLTLAARLPGPATLQRVRVGIDLYTPPTDFIHLAAPGRVDTPSWPMYDQRLDHLRAAVAAGVELTDDLALGATMMVQPVLTADTFVGYEAGRGDSTAENVVVNADRSLKLGAAAVLGARWSVLPKLAIGATYRQRQGGQIAGRTRVAAGSVVIEDTLDFFQTWNPAEVALGAQVGAIGPVTASADVVWARWSEYRTIRDERPDPAFRDVLDLRIGGELEVSRLLLLRGGYALEPTPVPPQVADSNFLDARRHVIALGVGFDLAARGVAPVRIDLHARAHLLETRQATKQVDRLSDADPDLPGQQVDNLGYPGLKAGGQFWQAGVALVFARRGDDDD